MRIKNHVQMTSHFGKIWSWFADDVPYFIIGQDNIAVYKMIGEDVPANSKKHNTYLNTTEIPKTLFGMIGSNTTRLEMHTTDDIFDALVLLLQSIVEENDLDASITIEECVNERVCGYRVRIDKPITRIQLDHWNAPF